MTKQMSMIDEIKNWPSDGEGEIHEPRLLLERIINAAWIKFDQNDEKTFPEIGEYLIDLGEYLTTCNFGSYKEGVWFHPAKGYATPKRYADINLFKSTEQNS